MFDIGNDFRRAMTKIKELEQNAPTNDVKQLAAAVNKALSALEQRLVNHFQERR